ncbi:MAG: cytochrome P450 [Arenibacterium sp.]
MALKTGDDGLPFLPSEDFSKLSLSELDALRREHRVVRVHPMRVVALRNEDIHKLISDARLIQLPGPEYCAASGIAPGRCQSFLTNFMLMMNGPEHQRLRAAFARTFAHPVMRGKREDVRRVADRIVADLPRGEPFDFLDLCASRLPAEMIAEVLGLPVSQSRWFAEQVYSLSRCLMVPYDVANHDEIDAAAETLYQFVDEAMTMRRDSPQEDLLSMLATDESARALDPETLNYQVMGLILAGSDTTRSGFNVTVGLLLGNRSVWDEINANRDLIPQAIEEALRVAPPVGSTPRFSPAPVELPGTTIPAMQVVGLSTLSAMRDEEQLIDPERFDLHRKDAVKPNMVFGGGAHRCLGEMLARIEMEEGLAALMDAVPDIELVTAPRLLGNAGIRRSTPLIARIP